jgi:hypothetical protein
MDFLGAMLGGYRREELLALEWTAVNFDEKPGENF